MNPYQHILQLHSDGQRRDVWTRDGDDTLTEVLIDSGHLFGSRAAVINKGGFEQVQITPAGLELLTNLKKQQWNASFFGKFSMPAVFIIASLFGTLIGIAVNDVWAAYVRPHLASPGYDKQTRYEAEHKRLLKATHHTPPETTKLGNRDE